MSQGKIHLAGLLLSVSKWMKPSKAVCPDRRVGGSLAYPQTIRRRASRIHTRPRVDPQPDPEVSTDGLQTIDGIRLSSWIATGDVMASKAKPLLAMAMPAFSMDEAHLWRRYLVRLP